MEVPSTIRVKRRREDNPVQALVVNKRLRRRGADGDAADAELPPQFSPAGAYLVFRLQKTEAGELSKRLGVPVAMDFVPKGLAAPQNKTTGLSVHVVESTPAPKRKAAPGSPLAPTNVPGIAHTPPTPGANQLTMPKTLSTHAHPPGGKTNTSYLQVPQPRKYHLAHRVTPKRGSGHVSLGRRNIGGVCSGGGSLNHSVVFIEGDEVKTGAGVYREKKRRRERKEELRMRLSRESLREKEKSLATAVVEPPAVQMVHTPRKKPNVAPQEKKENEERKRQIVGKMGAFETSGMDVDVPEVVQETKPIMGPLGKDAHRHPSRDNIDNDDDKLSAQLQAMVLEYLNDQEGITNLPPTPVPMRKRPFPRTQMMIGGGVGGGSLEKADRKPVMDDGSLTATEDESEQSEEEGWVYDVYVREKADEDRKFVGHSGAPTIEASDDAGMEPHIPGITTGDYGVLVISNPVDEEWFYNGSWDDGGKSEEDGLSNDEDSNAEDYHTNDYPDEEDIDEDYDDLYSEEEENEAYSLNDDDSFLEHRLYDLRRTIHGPNSTEFSSSSHGDESESEGDAREKVHGSVKWALPSSRGTAI